MEVTLRVELIKELMRRFELHFRDRHQMLTIF